MQYLSLPKGNFSAPAFAANKAASDWLLLSSSAVNNDFIGVC